MNSTSRPLAVVTGASVGIGYHGQADVVSGWKNKLQTALANVTPNSVLTEQHRKLAEPGSAKKAS